MGRCVALLSLICGGIVIIPNPLFSFPFPSRLLCPYLLDGKRGQEGEKRRRGECVRCMSDGGWAHMNRRIRRRNQYIHSTV